MASKPPNHGRPDLTSTSGKSPQVPPPTLHAPSLAGPVQTPIGHPVLPAMDRVLGQRPPLTFPVNGTFTTPTSPVNNSFQYCSHFYREGHFIRLPELHFRPVNTYLWVELIFN